MLMADTIAIFLIILGLLITWNALWLLCRGLWPQATIACRDQSQGALLRNFWRGFPTTILMIILTIFFGQVAGNLPNVGGLSKMLAFVVVFIYFIYANVGLAGLVTLLGDKLRSTSEGPPWKSTLCGGSVMVLCFLLPFVGWFFIMPVAILVGCGTRARTRKILVAKPDAPVVNLETPTLQK